MKKFILLLVLFFLSAPAYAVVMFLKCKSGTPAPTECQCTLGTGVPVAAAPVSHAALPPGLYCPCDFKTLTSGTVSWKLVPVNSMGPGPASVGTTDLNQIGPPVQLEGTPIFLPAMPQ